MTVPGGQIINIAGKTPVDDPHYRYKMPAVFGKIGNGKTNILNISEVALSLHRSPGEVNKFFGCELGAQTTYTPEIDRAIVNGAHTDTVLRGLMHRYIETFVLCSNCRLPETDYKIKNECIYQKCAACGAREIVDMSHKLCNYILAQDKKAKKEAKKGDGKGKDDKKKAKEEKKKDRKKEKEGSDEEKKKKNDKDKNKKKCCKVDTKEVSWGEENGGDLGSSNFSESVNAAIGVARIPSGAASRNAHFHESDDEEDEAVKQVAPKGNLKRGDEVSFVLGTSSPHQECVDDEGALGYFLQLAVEGTRKFLEENPTASADEIVEMVTNQQISSALKAHDKVLVLAQAAITPKFFKTNVVSKYAPAFAKIVNGNAIIERHLIAALEALCVDKPKNFPVMLKQFYDEDVIEEETILAWAEEGRNEYTLEVVDEETRAALRGEAEPVVVWLQEPDSDDEDEEED